MDSCKIQDICPCQPWISSCNQIFFKGHLMLKDGTKVEVFEQPECGPLTFTKKFLQLWVELFDIGTYNNLGGFTSENLPFPVFRTSKLIGKSVFTNPSSTLRPIAFSLINNGGPILSVCSTNSGTINGSKNSITTNNFTLNVFSSALFLKISWSVRNSKKTKPHDKSIKIGFYTSDDPNYVMDNRVRLICGNKGPALFTTNPSCHDSKEKDDKNHENNKEDDQKDKKERDSLSGSFNCAGIVKFFVVADQDVDLLLKVTAVAPKEWSFPDVTCVHPFTKQIRIENHCEKETKIPVYTLTLDEFDSSLIEKVATPTFFQAAALIVNYLLTTSLPITLWVPFPEPITSDQPTVITNQRTEFLNLPAARSTTSFVLTDTTSLDPNVRCSFWFDRFIGIRLREPNDGNSVPFVTFNISIINNTTFDSIVPTFFCAMMGYGKINQVLTQLRLDITTGEELGSAEITFPAIPSGSASVVIEGVMMLKENTMTTIFGVKFALSNNTPIDIADTVEIVFNSITIEYVPKPIFVASIINKQPMSKIVKSIQN